MISIQKRGNSMNLKKVMLSIIALALSSQLSANELVIGELKGTAQVKYVSTIKDQVYQNSKDCPVAINLYKNEDFLSMEYSLFQCPGLGTWNGPLWIVKKIGSDLFKSNRKGETFEKIGQLENDGTWNFTFKQQVTETVTIVEPDFNCKLGNIKKKSIKLNQSASYKVKAISDKAFDISEKYETNKVVLLSERDGKNCSVYIPYVQNSKTDSKYSVSK